MNCLSIRKKSDAKIAWGRCKKRCRVPRRSAGTISACSGRDKPQRTGCAGARGAIGQHIRPADIRALDGNLSGYYRLRVGRHRIIFNYATDRAIEALFIEERQLVYEVFEARFINRLKS